MMCCLVNRDVVCIVNGTSMKDMHQNKTVLRWSHLLGKQGTGDGG